MTVTGVTKDLEARTMKLTARFDAPITRLWRVWSDPRELERWWGPPPYPATVLEHELIPGGNVTYLMTGPEGDQHRGWWQVRSVQSPRYLEFEDGFADETGKPNPEMPTTTVRVTLAHSEQGGTEMQIASTFPSTRAMEQLLTMGVEAGLTSAVGQIDALLSSEGTSTASSG